MEEPLDEDGGSQVPSRPTVKKKDGLDDPPLAYVGPDLDSPGETVNQGPNHAEAVPEESRSHGVDQSPNDSATGVLVNSDDVGPRSDLNSSDTGPEAVSIGVAPVDGSPSSVTAEVLESPNNVALEVENPNDEASDAVSMPSDVAPGEVENPGNAVLGSILVTGGSGPVLAPNPDNGDHVAGILSDDTLGVNSEPDNFASWFGELDDGAVQKLGMVVESEIAQMEQNGAPEDEVLWRRALAEQDCSKLTELLAKDVTYFWKYEKKNKVGTALHAAATGRDLKLVRRILHLLSSAQEACDLDVRFADTRLDIDSYVELETDAQGNTALVVAEANNHAAIESKIRDYIAKKDKRREYDEKSGARAGSLSSRALPEISKWNDAIKNKDCLALLKIVPNKSFQLSYVEEKLRAALVDLEVKNGKGGRQTALQIAAMQGCSKLAEFMFNHIKATSYHNLIDYIMARDEVSGLTAFEMANDVIGNRSIAEYMKNKSLRYVNLKRMLHLNSENDNHQISWYELQSFEAYPGTRWYRALKRGDTRELKELVQVNSRFILETCHGLTVLHVAILWDDLELVKVVLNLFRITDEYGERNIKWGESYYPEKLSLDGIMTVSRKIDHGYLKEYCELLTKGMLKQLDKEGNTVKSFADILKRREILDELDKANSISTLTSNGSTNMDYSLTMSSRTRNFFKKNWTPAFDVEFQKDVDFNFEDPLRKNWLRVHYACKHPLKFKDFLQRLASFIMQPPYEATKLLQIWDGKGRTPFHILMDHYDDNKDPGWPFDEVFDHQCFKELIQIVENPRGKRIIDIIFSKNYLQRNVILRPWNYFKLNFNYEKFERSKVASFLCYQVAYLLKQKDVGQEIWSRFLDKKDLLYVMLKDQDAFNSMVFLAASTGNQTCLQLLLEISEDPMITDSNGGSLLHHAADPTILLSQLLGHCCLTVEDVIHMRMKLMVDYYAQPSSSTSCDDHLKGSNIVHQNGSNSTTMHRTTYSNGTHALHSSSLDNSSGERSNVGRKACVLMLLQAGVDLGQSNNDNDVPTIGPTIDANYQSWWYDMVVKDSTERKQALSQAGNALSVVGTLVAATSYVGPLQPPLSFDNTSGFVKTSEPLIKVFMVSNSVAFYLAMASVMFAVVSSLPMPQEGVISELNRAKHVISLSLCLLQIAIGSIIISYAMASIVAIQNEQMFHPSDLLFSPSIIGWFFCLLGIGGFLLRLARLTFYKNRVVRGIYQFRFSKNIPKYVWVIVKRLLWVIVVVLFGIVYCPLWVILVCLQFISSMMPFLECRSIDMNLWSMRDDLEDFFMNVLLWS